MDQNEAHRTLLIKPTGSGCNLTCRYCFYRESHTGFSKKRMTDSLLEILISQLCRLPASGISIIWQGGEPTLMGLDFFQRMISLLQRTGQICPVDNALQTNGILLDRNWARFLSRHGFLVGLSLDGPEFIHDHYRRDINGRGSWRQVQNKAMMLQDEGVAVNAMITISNRSAHHADDIYEYFKNLGINHLQFVPCLESLPSQETIWSPFSVSAEDYGTFLIRMFDLWMADIKDGTAQVSIRWFDSLFHSYLGLSAPDCTLQETCGTYLTIDADGGVYPCDFFVEPAWRLGQLDTDSLTDLFQSTKLRAFGNLKSQYANGCLTCAWQRVCRGGCLKDRCRTDNPFCNPLCESYRSFFTHAHEKMTLLAQNWWKSEQNPI